MLSEKYLAVVDIYSLKGPSYHNRNLKRCYVEKKYILLPQFHNAKIAGNDGRFNGPRVPRIYLPVSALLIVMFRTVNLHVLQNMREIKPRQAHCWLPIQMPNLPIYTIEPRCPVWQSERDRPPLKVMSSELFKGKVYVLSEQKLNVPPINPPLLFQRNQHHELSDW
jgi:hypothetical protein